MEPSQSPFSITVQGTTLSGLSRRVVEANLLSKERVRDTFEAAQKSHRSFLQEALDQGDVDRTALLRCASEESGMPLMDLSAFDLDCRPQEIVDGRFLETHGVLPLFQRGSKVFLAVPDPSDVSGLDAFTFQTGFGVEAILVDPRLLTRVIRDIVSGISSELADLNEDPSLEDLATKTAAPSTTETAEVDTPVVRFVNKILMDAIRQKASDIHIEPYEGKLRIRYRLDGVLHEIANPPLSLAARITARVKILSHLDIAERRIPQDGRIKLTLSKGHEIDFRVSTLPTQFGEKVVIRVLDSSGADLSVSALGLEPEQLKAYEDAIHRPHGMILVTGPTGSGKTVSLYSALSTLNSPEVNISSVEDPIEINLPGINQVNINEKANLSFARALRAFLRQDPDIIMVGEVRDLETADIAIKASQTGHLVLSTLHTNDAPSTIVRLLNMGVAPFNVAASVHLILAQRLVRKLCTACRKPVEYPEEVLTGAGFSESGSFKSLKLFGPEGCDECTRGYKGRTGVFQVMPVTEAIAELIVQNTGQESIEKQSIAEGIMTMRQAGLVKVRAGVTSLEEVLRVTDT
ncbi:MAG: type IV-A pilus assembly ATPase PilB [Candidatus Thioglobus sp.]|nr:MAG: type IV-A pilus assembly ATPase PilB [Candidatus Thioglobus sp.]